MVFKTFLIEPYVGKRRKYQKSCNFHKKNYSNTQNLLNFAQVPTKHWKITSMLANTLLTGCFKVWFVFIIYSKSGFTNSVQIRSMVTILKRGVLPTFWVPRFQLEKKLNTINFILICYMKQESVGQSTFRI